MNDNSLHSGVNHSIYAFKDEDLGFTEIFTLQNDAMAVRQFTELCNRKDAYFNKYYDKVSLWKLGSFNDKTGIISADEKEPKCLIEGKQCYIPQTA